VEHVTNPKDFQGTDKEFKELAKQVQADAGVHTPSTPSKQSLAEGVE
jgi:hypothetical protein